MKKTLLFAFVSMFAMQANAATQDLINSVKAGNVKEVIELLNSGEDVNGTNGIGTTALHYAVASDNAEITQILLSYGADLNATNNNGWTPLKIAEKKDLKNVTPVLVKYLQLQKNDVENLTDQDVKETVEVVKEIPVQVKEVAVETVEAVKDVPVQIKEVTEEQVNVVKDTNTQTNDAVKENIDTAITEATKEVDKEYQEMLDLATQAVIEARSAQTKAEAESKILADELKQIKAEKAELESRLAKEEKINKEMKAKEAEVAAKEEPKKEEAKKEEPKKEETKKTVAVKTTPKPVLQKKPAYKAPQPIVKKVEIKPSTIVEGIYAGDEEIVYCLDYLGNGEDDNLKRAAGHFAASSSISEARYKQIVDKAREYFLNASDNDMNIRNAECSQIITPSDHNKANQIIRSMNKSVGY